MQYKIIFLITLLIAPTAYALSPTCEIPVAAETRFAELCEIIRRERRIRTADWSEDACATNFMRIGVRRVELKHRAGNAQEAMSNIVQSDMNTFDADFTDESRTLETRCGDGITQTEFGETCDDGNRDSGDGCDGRCKIE